MAALEHLSERDKAVLRSIFDPTATIGDIVEDAETDKFVEEDDGMYVLYISIIIVNGIVINIWLFIYAIVNSTLMLTIKMLRSGFYSIIGIMLGFD